MSKIYKTLSNYERLFRVEIDEKNKTAEIYADAWEELIPKKLTLKTKIDFVNQEHVMSLRYQNYYVGNSHYTSLDLNTYEVSKRIDLSYVGNTILFHIENDQYFYIGHVIGEIQFSEKVLDYFSPVYRGNAYPYIVCEKNAYLILNGGFVPKNYLMGINPYLKENYITNINAWKQIKASIFVNKTKQKVCIPDYIRHGVPPPK
jgi:hypothetical protein